MAHIKKLYEKAYHLYNIEDWKYMFSILKEKDKYNHTEEEFLAAELIDKTAMMKMMDDNISNASWSTTIDEHVKPLVDSCSKNNCEIIQDFLKDDDDSFSIYRAARREYQDAMTSCENRIEQYKQNIRTEIQEIYIHQQQHDEALKTYLK